jgi:hypothetical protein
MQDINPNLYPSGGWVFVDARGSKIEGDSKDHLIQEVAAHYLRTGRDAAKAEEDVVEQICSRQPDLCRTSRKMEVRTTPDQIFMLRVIQWLSRIRLNVASWKKPFVSFEEASRRANICRKCPEQRTWREYCVGCTAGAAHLGEVLRGGRKVEREEELLGCRILQEDTKTSVWIDGLRPAESDELPAVCWRKKACS